MLKDYRIAFLKPREAALITGDFDETTGEGEIFGRNILSMISTGSERGGFTSEYEPSYYPMQTGYSSIGQVVSVGEGVTDLKPGDLFYHNEHHTLYVKVKAEDAIALPGGIMPEKALFGRFAAVTMTSMFHSKSKPVDNVVVTGLGIVGLMGAQMLKSFGYRVYGIDPSADRRNVAKASGIENVAESIEQWPELKGKAAVLYDIFYGFISVHSGFEWSIPRKEDDFHSHSNYSHIRMAMELIADGRVKIVDDMYELRDPRECGEVYQEILVPRMKPTSIMFDWRNFKEDRG